MDLLCIGQIHLYWKRRLQRALAYITVDRHIKLYMLLDRRMNFMTCIDTEDYRRIVGDFGRYDLEMNT